MIQISNYIKRFIQLKKLKLFPSSSNPSRPVSIGVVRHSSKVFQALKQRISASLINHYKQLSVLWLWGLWLWESNSSFDLVIMCPLSTLLSPLTYGAVHLILEMIDAKFKKKPAKTQLPQHILIKADIRCFTTYFACPSWVWLGSFISWCWANLSVIITPTML